LLEGGKELRAHEPLPRNFTGGDARPCRRVSASLGTSRRRSDPKGEEELPLTYHKLLARGVGILIGAVALTWLLAGPIGAANADCPGLFAHVQGKADSGSSTDNVQGFRNSIHTADMDWQCWSVRSSAVYKDGNDWLELGWIKATDNVIPQIINETPEVFVSRKIAGQPFSQFYPLEQPSPGTAHPYKISNGGGDLDWRVEYNDDNLGLYSTGFRHASNVVTNSERHKTTDNLWDHHDNVQICTGTSGDCDGRWHDPAEYYKRDDSAGDYDFCRDSIRESHVKQSC
jgi:hypothetical protein